jgi:uncharacterized protein (TIGR00369 family)
VDTELHQLGGCLDPSTWNRISIGRLPGLVGMEMVEVDFDRLLSQLVVRDELLAPNGFLHAATVVALADTTCGYATVVNLPTGAQGFTTVELKSNHFGTARDGTILCVATPLHRGRTTQVWDAAVTRESDSRLLASFRCTQMILGVS